jgi:hypothetical protein
MTKPLLILMALTSVASAADKSQYNLFNPTPREQMRDFSTDRPDVTESPYTLDAGHFQIEMSLVEYTHDRSHGRSFDAFSIAPTNLKVGLLNNLDLQLVLEPYIHQTDADGFGSTQLRLKLNVLGNDGGDVAFGLMPFVQFPTADDDLGGSDHVEGGLIVPLTIALPRDWSLATMLEIDILRDADNEHYGVALVHTASLSHEIVKNIDGFVEYVGVANDDLGAGYQASAGGGVTWLVTPNMQLDTAIYFGLSEQADDLLALTGISWRF